MGQKVRVNDRLLSVAFQSNVIPDDPNQQETRDWRHATGDKREILDQRQIEKIVAETVAKTMPIMFTSFLASTGFQPRPMVEQGPQATTDSPPEPSQNTSRSDRFFNKESTTSIPDDLLELSKKAFSTALSKEKWLELLQSYPPIKDTDSFLLSPKLEAGMKEALRSRHGHLKTKDVLAFDEGLADQQTPFLLVTRPLLAVLTTLEAAVDEGPDPDSIKDYLEDALVMVGNAHVRLNNWRQRRFSDFLTDIGKRTLREGIPTDKHLFPDKFHEKIKDEHDHSSTTRKVISTPLAKPASFNRQTHQSRFQPFRGNTNNRGSNDRPRQQLKRSWSRSRSNHSQAKRPRPANSPIHAEPSQL